MTTLKAFPRTIKRRKVSQVRKERQIPAVLYGPKENGVLLAVSEKEFERVYREAGEVTLISLQVGTKEIPVLVRQLQRDPVKGTPVHIDFYQPLLDKKIEIMVPVIFEGTAPAVKDLGGTLIKNVREMRVRALPADLPREIRIEVSRLATFEDKILVKDIAALQGVEVFRDENDIVAQVVPPEKVEEELAKPVEEKVEEVAKVEKPKEEEATETQEAPPSPSKAS